MPDRGAAGFAGPVQTAGIHVVEVDPDDLATLRACWELQRARTATVDPAHRRQGVGTALYAAAADRLRAEQARTTGGYERVPAAARRHDDGVLAGCSTPYLHRHHPERTALHTWIAPANHAMRRTNSTFGYTPVELMHEMQRRLR